MLCSWAIIFSVVWVVNGRCKVKNSPGKLHFRTKMNILDFGHKSRYAHIDCCATGFDRLDWFHKGKGDITWKSYPFSWKNIGILHLMASNQTLVMTSTPMKAKGKFKCVAKNFTSGQTISHVLSYGVDDSYGRSELIPYAPKKHVCVKDSSVSVSCKGDFGSLDNTERDVSWYYFDPVNGTLRFIKDSRVSVKNFTRHDNTVLGCILHIGNVTSKDIGSIYQCSVGSTLSNGRSYSFNTTLIKCGQEKRLNKQAVAKIVGISVSVVIVFIVAIITIRWVCGDRILQNVRQRFPRKYLKVMGGPDTDIGYKEYHVLVHYPELQQEEDMAKQIRDMITSINEGYRVCTRQDASDENTLFAGLGELADKTASLFLILPVATPETTPYNVSDEDINNTELENQNTGQDQDNGCAIRNDGPDEVFDNRHQIIQKYKSEVSSILEDHFKDQRKSVTVISRNKASISSNRFGLFKGLYTVIAGDKNSWTRRACLYKLMRRMPLPLPTSPTSISRNGNGQQFPEQRNLLGSTGSDDVGDGGNYVV